MAAHLQLTHLFFQQQKNPNTFKKDYDHVKSFTSVPVSIDARCRADNGADPVSPLLYSGFLEHLGRCIYGGIVDNKKDPSPAELLIEQGDGKAGWRKDVQKVLAADGELAVPMMRWPGGNYVSNYHWQDGVGPIKDRPKRVELAWLTTESNQFGTNEFIDMCRANKWEPFICLNMGTGTLEEALAWVEYCNSTGDTYWANLRREHTGRDEPHNVKYWGLGNEMWGPWQVGNIEAKDYAAKAKQWAHAIKLVDPTVKLISSGETGFSLWDREVLSEVVPYVDMHSLHFYSSLFHEYFTAPGHNFEKNVFSPAAAEAGIKITKSLIDLVNCDNSFRGVPAKDVKICYDEWNVWDQTKAGTDIGLEQIYDFTDLLATAAWLNLLVRQSKDVTVACIAQSCNVISPILTKPDGLLKQCTFYPLQLFSKYMRDGYLLQVPDMPDYYDGPTWPYFVQQIGCNPRYIDLVAMVKGDGDNVSIRCSVLNRHPELDWDATAIKFGGVEIETVTVHEMYSDDLAAANSWEEPEKVTPEVSKYTAQEWADRKPTVRKHSWQFIIVDGKKSA